jgi:hypothetical protein
MRLPTALKRRKNQEGKPEYLYSTLNEEAQEVRLLTILPGEKKSDIRVRLEVAGFTEGHVPEFEVDDMSLSSVEDSADWLEQALSYAWGSKKHPIKVFVSDSNNPVDSTLAVTQNLAKALPYLRYKDRPRMLWIDAICINQEDLVERSSQVCNSIYIFLTIRWVQAVKAPYSQVLILK